MAKKDYNYFNKFVELVDYSCKCADILHETLADLDASITDKMVTDIHSIEHAGDIAKHEMMSHLAKEFIAPIEREDIVELSQQIDEVTDSIEEVIMKMYMYNITTVKPEVLEFTKLIKKCASTLKVALEEFPNYKKSATLKEKLIEVSHLEEEGDRLYYSTVHNLYANSKDPLELYVWTEIYELLEKCCDACADVADVVESVVMKNS